MAHRFVENSQAPPSLRALCSDILVSGEFRNSSSVIPHDNRTYHVTVTIVCETSLRKLNLWHCACNQCVSNSTIHHAQFQMISTLRCGSYRMSYGYVPLHHVVQKCSLIQGLLAAYLLVGEETHNKFQMMVIFNFGTVFLCHGLAQDSFGKMQHVDR